MRSFLDILKLDEMYIPQIESPRPGLAQTSLPGQSSLLVQAGVTVNTTKGFKIIHFIITFK